MRSPANRVGLLLLAAAVIVLPACSKDAPPAPTPEPVADPTPAPVVDRTPEPADPGDWTEAEAPEQSFLSAEEINARQLLGTIYFDYDKSEIRADQRTTLQANANWLREHSDVTILIEGHCDERGTRQYNMALGDRRAQAARDYLISLGLDASRIEFVSYGEENPAVMGEGEQTWSLNRRAEFVATSAARVSER